MEGQGETNVRGRGRSCDLGSQGRIRNYRRERHPIRLEAASDLLGRHAVPVYFYNLGAVSVRRIVIRLLCANSSAFTAEQAIFKS